MAEMPCTEDPDRGGLRTGDLGTHGQGPEGGPQARGRCRENPRPACSKHPHPRTPGTSPQEAKASSRPRARWEVKASTVSFLLHRLGFPVGRGHVPSLPPRKCRRHFLNSARYGLSGGE